MSKTITLAKNQWSAVRFFTSPTQSSKKRLIFFAFILGVIGTYTIAHTLAATSTVGLLEAENMTLPAGASIISDTAASGSNAVLLRTNGTATGQVSLSAASNQISVRAKGVQCNGAPQLVVAVDNVQVQASSISSSSWTDYSAAINVASGVHTISVSFTNDYIAYRGSKVKCNRDLYVDKITFFGDIPDTTPPTAAVLSATPGDQQVSLIWTEATDNVGVSRYEVWKDNISIASLPSTERSYIATGLVNGTAYSFRVVAYDAAGNYTDSNTVSATPAVSTGWKNVIDDQFDAGGVPTHWHLYDGPYGSNSHNCAVPSHVSVSGGFLHLLLQYETSGQCGASWYSAGMSSDSSFASVDQRVTVRWRIVSNGVTSHRIIPMRFPSGNEPWPTGGEEDMCEGGGLTGCSAYFHYGTSSPGQQVCLPGNCGDWSVDLTQWHTMRFQRLNHIMTVWIDDLSTPISSYTGDSTTLPDTLKNVILQQECSGFGCPSGTTGSEDIQIDWIQIDNPA